MVFVDKGKSLLAAGNQSVMLKIDVTKGNVIAEVSTDSEYAMMKVGRYICAATSTGAIDLLEPSTFHRVHSWQAHTASVNDIGISGLSLISCGRAVKPHGPAMFEGVAKVLDLKSMEQMAPIPFQTGAAYIRVHPKLSTTCVLGGTSGQLQVIDLVNHNTSSVVMAGTRITHFEMSGSSFPYVFGSFRDI